jgi:1,4-dihydroxy-2-naphthoyl-CoA synthase
MSAQNTSTAKITVERRGEIVLIGVNRPQVHNRFDPDAFFGLARAYYDFDNDPSLRAAVLFGHGDESEAVAFAKLNEQFGALFHTKDFLEGRQAEAAGRPPVYQGC